MICSALQLHEEGKRVVDSVYSRTRMRRVCEAIEGRSQLCVSKRRGTDGSDVPTKGRALALGPWVLYYVMICCWYGVGGGVGGSFRR